MKKFKVTFSESGTEEYEVEAKGFQQARDKFQTEENPGELARTHKTSHKISGVEEIISENLEGKLCDGKMETDLCQVEKWWSVRLEGKREFRVHETYSVFNDLRSLEVFDEEGNSFIGNKKLREKMIDSCKY